MRNLKVLLKMVTCIVVWLLIGWSTGIPYSVQAFGILPILVVGIMCMT